MSSSKKSLADFKTAHDKSYIVPTKIKAAIEKLGTDGWEYEQEFAKLSGVSSNDLAKYREMFSEQIVLIKQDGRERRAWAGSKSLANKMREMVNQ
jgi:hypothetical protein